MNRSLKIAFVSSLIPLIIICIGIKELSLSLIAIGTIVESFILLFVITSGAIYKFSLNKKRVLQFENEYELKLLDNTKKEVFVFEKNVAECSFYIFSYINHDGKLVSCIKKVADIKKLDKTKPYVKIYKNIYEPKGYLDWMFYTKEDEIQYIYELYVKNNHIELI